MERLTDTIIYNSSVLNKNERQCQRNIFSTQIPPENMHKAKVKFSKILNKTLIDIDAVIGEYEVDVPIGTYVDFGASMFVFGYKDIE
ncbi:MAG: hypothetical protein JKX98_02220 [Alcanivoracaceae bacterium]|nr:hypothetical protein [Alcanivoracaceae bacterium]